MRHSLCAFLACLALVAPLVGEVDVERQPTAPTSYFGINGSKLFHIPEHRDTIAARRFEWMKELGVRWDRIDLWWHIVEPEPGVFDWTRSDMAFDTFESHGVQWYPILCYGAAWFEPPGRTAPQTDEEIAAFARYAGKTVARYRGRAPYWEVWNEPNIGIFWSPNPDPIMYARLLKAAAPEIRAADPDALICAPSLAPLGQWDRTFTEAFLREGTAPYFDVFDYHYYRNSPPENTVARELAEIRAVLRRFDAEKPIHISESGITTGMPGVEDPEDLQASLIVRNHLLALANGASKFYYFDLQNWDDESTWDGKLGLVTAAGEKKKSFEAYRMMVEQVDGQRIIGSFQDEWLHGVLMENPETGDLKLAFWQLPDRGSDRRPSSGITRVMLTLPYAPLVHPYTGSPIMAVLVPPLPENRLYSDVVVPDQHPAYITSVDPMEYLPRAGVRLDPVLTILAPGEDAPLSLHLDRAIVDPVVTYKSVECDPGISWDPETGRVAVAEDVAPGEYGIRATMTLAHGAGERREAVERQVRASVEVLPLMTLSIRPYLDGDTLHVAGNILNHAPASRTADARLWARHGDEKHLLTERTGLEVPPDTLHRETLTLDPASLATMEQVHHWTLEFGPFEGRPFGVAPVALLDTAPEIDGAIDEWQELPALVIDQRRQLFHTADEWSPENLSGRAWIAFDETTLYIAAEVHDNDPMVAAESPHQMWRADSIEVFLGFNGPTTRTVIDGTFEYQLGIAPTGGPDNAPVAFWFHKDVVLETATVAAQRTDTGYTIEAAIPLAALGEADRALGPGKLIALDVTLNDLDTGDFGPEGVDPGRRMAWNGTGANWINPAGYGMGVLRRFAPEE